jgi:hypothetical protein
MPTTGAEAKPGAVVPSIVTGLIISGRDVERIIVPLVANMMVVPALLFAARIAARSDPAPESFRFVTVTVGATGNALTG